MAVEVDHRERSSRSARRAAPGCRSARAPPMPAAESWGWRLGRSWARRSSDSRTATGLRITPIGLGSRSRHSSSTSRIRGSLTPIVWPGIAPRISSRRRSRPPGDAHAPGGSHQEPPLRSRIASWSLLSSVISRLPRGLKRFAPRQGPARRRAPASMPGDRRGAAAVHPEHRDDRLVAQLLDRLASRRVARSVRRVLRRRGCRSRPRGARTEASGLRSSPPDDPHRDRPLALRPLDRHPASLPGAQPGRGLQGLRLARRGDCATRRTSSSTPPTCRSSSTS